MPYGWKIELNSVDISGKANWFNIARSKDMFCKELTLNIIDKSLSDSFDFSQIPETPEITVYTRTGSNWELQGQFYFERPKFIIDINSELMQGVWGRSLTAMLSEPFAPKVTKVWTEQTTFYAICDEVCDLAGFTWNSAYCEVDDFVIYPYTFEVENLFPIEVITELLNLAEHPTGFVTTDRLDHLCIKKIKYSPSSEDITITDAEIKSVEESSEWPEFANRLRITPIGSLGSYSVNLFIPNKCLQADASSKQKLYTRITDPEGDAVNGLVVTWDHDAASATLDYEKTNTQQILIQNEQQKASNFYTLKVDIPPSSIVGVWALADTARAKNFAAGGYTIDGNTVTLTDKLDYCDQTVIVSYYAEGMAVNYITSGFVAEDVTVMADLEGQQDSGIVYIGNPCQCPPTIKLTAAPTSVVITGQSQIIVYVEESGPVTVGRVVYVSQISRVHRGTLRWSTARLGTVKIKNEETVAINEISGFTQCELSMFPASVTSVYKVNEEGVSYGSNLYSSHDGKLVTLNASVESGIDLHVNYTAQGAVLNRFTGSSVGTALIKASILSSREEGVSDSVEITVTDSTSPIEDYPPDWDDGGDGGYYDDKDEDEEYDQNNEDSVDDFNWCVPDKGTTGARFSTALEHDCDCELLCNEEFDIYGTTQGYGGGSGKKISQLALEQCSCEQNSAEYWEKYAELKAEALEHCQGQCECEEGMEWDTENSPETIVAGESVQVFVTGGRAPFTWSVSGIGYNIFIEETASRVNQVSCVSGVCGTDFDASVSITVTDDCGKSITGELRNTGGQWISQGACRACCGTCQGFEAGDCDTSTCTSETEIIQGTKRWVLSEVCYEHAWPCSIKSLASGPEGCDGCIPCDLTEPPVEHNSSAYSYYTWGGCDV